MIITVATVNATIMCYRFPAAIHNSNLVLNRRAVSQSSDSHRRGPKNELHVHTKDDHRNKKTNGHRTAFNAIMATIIVERSTAEIIIFFGRLYMCKCGHRFHLFLRHAGFEAPRTNFLIDNGFEILY